MAGVHLTDVARKSSALCTKAGSKWVEVWGCGLAGGMYLLACAGSVSVHLLSVGHTKLARRLDDGRGSLMREPNQAVLAPSGLKFGMACGAIKVCSCLNASFIPFSGLLMFCIK